jgi:two-component system, OmpR family, KDP operon response regulator KdpE
MTDGTILVIDDELHIRQFLRAAFEFEGFTVHEACNAEEGVRSATLKPPDLIILDLGLPDRDGASIIERLRSWSNIPIIVLTVRSREREKVRLLELGADDYVVKPFGIGELIARARAALRPRAAPQAGEPVVRVRSRSTWQCDPVRSTASGWCSVPRSIWSCRFSRSMRGRS